jgi:hypothetical protein
VFGCIKTFSVIRKTRRKRKRRTQCGGWSMWRKTRIVAVWHFLPSPVTFFILLRMNANNKKTGNKGAHPSHSPKCVFVCVRACMYSSPFFFLRRQSLTRRLYTRIYFTQCCTTRVLGQCRNLALLDLSQRQWFRRWRERHALDVLAWSRQWSFFVPDNPYWVTI